MTEVDDANSTPLSRQAIMAIFMALLVAMFAAALDQTVVATALPTIVGDLDGATHMLWVTTAYVLASTVAMPIYGKLGDLIGQGSLPGRAGPVRCWLRRLRPRGRHGIEARND